MERALAKLYFQAVAIEKTVRDAHVPEVEELKKSSQEKRVGKYYFAPLCSEVFWHPNKKAPHYQQVLHLVGPTRGGYIATSATLQESS